MSSKVEQVLKKREQRKNIKRALGVGVLAAGLATSFLGWDYLTKRLNVPERNVLFRATQELSFSGGERPNDEYQADKTATTFIYKGSYEGGDSKIEDILAKTEYTTSDYMHKYFLKNKDNLNIVSSSLKNEMVQAGLSLRGSVNYQEQFATITPETSAPSLAANNPVDDKRSDSFYIYRIEPERGLDEVEVDAVRVNGQKRLLNRLVESRSVGLGWLYGKTYRAGTSLEKYDLPESDPRVQEFFKLVEKYNTTETSLDQNERMRLIDQIASLEARIPRKPIYFSYEDGLVDWNFQESTIFLGEQPGMWKRASTEVVDFLEQLKERVTLGFWDKAVWPDGVIRVENKWDVLPGSVPWLRDIRHDSGNKVLSLFDKTNNGGYVLLDNKGTLGEVRILDYWLHHDQDTVYEYYLDKSGDGKIDRDKELIGRVLFRVTYGQREKEMGEISKDKPKKDMTYVYNYSFMGGQDTSPNGRYNDFLLCAYLESMMPDQLNRGYGKHSRMGHINEVRSSIILLNDRNFGNISRALNEENALVAAHDIYHVLKATKRPFAEKFAGMVGLNIDDAGYNLLK